MKINTKHRYFKISLCAFGVVAASIVFFLVLQNLPYLSSMLDNLKGILSPFIYAFAIAYILNYPYRWCMRQLDKIHTRRPLKKGVKKAISCFVIYLLFCALATTFFYIVAPQIGSALMGFINVIPQYTDEFSKNIQAMLNDYFARYNMSATDVNTVLNSISQNISGVLNVKALMLGVVNMLVSMSIEIKNFLIGIIISIYFLVDKERFSMTGKKILYAFFPKNAADKTLDVLRFTDKTFGGFVIAKVVDSAIIGVLCYIGMLLLGLEYAVLISVLIGVTNMIPFFGPFLGAIPATLLLLLVNPWQALIFVVFIIILQQFDGNILGPKLLGESTGIRAVYVVFAVIVGGGLFGFLGMFIGVPLFAVIYALFSSYVNERLKKRQITIEPPANQ